MKSKKTLSLLFLSLLILFVAGFCLSNENGVRTTPTALQREDIIESRLRTLEGSQHDLTQEVESLKKLIMAKKESTSAIAPLEFQLSKSAIDDPFLGPKGAPVVLMAFFDFQCQPCRDFLLDTFPKLKAEFLDTNKIQFIVRDYPLENRNHSMDAAQFASCAGEQGSYWKVFSLLTENFPLVDRGDFAELAKLSQFNSTKILDCMKMKRFLREATMDRDDGNSLGVSAAPAFVLGRKGNSDHYRGVLIRGAQPYRVLRYQILKLLTDQEPSPDE